MTPDRLLGALIVCQCMAFAAPRTGADMVGAPAPALRLRQWIHSPPLDIADLKGSVVLIRWWTDTCELCAATAPALRKLRSEYQDRGLQVIGIFHPKPAGDWNIERMRRAADHLGFSFPVALDGDWTALRRWWLNGPAREFTSVSFVLDRQGVIRYVHRGGEFHEASAAPGHEKCERDWREIETLIGRLLAE